MIRFRLFTIIILSFCTLPAIYAAEHADTLPDGDTLDEIVITSKGAQGKIRHVSTSTEIISAAELTRAACCNLGESFTTNPSVDVSYADAATGARQIRLLGLAGTYVQMLTENIPNFRGAASPFGLGYIPGPWMQSIQVSKGASSVKNGYESISGQINVEMKKPQVDPSISVNGYADHRGKAELNFAGNTRITKKLSTALLLHGENAFSSHDENEDGFIDMPRIRQFSAMNRWAYLSTHYVFQAAIKYLAENRKSGQDKHHAHSGDMPLYEINIDTQRLEFFTKNAYIFDRENDGNIALILSGEMHNQNSIYGLKPYDMRQRQAYASLMFERKWNEIHALSAGLSFVYDLYHQRYMLERGASLIRANQHEAVPGAYAQYTLNLDSHLIAMAGLRLDHSSLSGTMFTPRLHVRWNPSSLVSANVSAGRGFRTPHPMAELNYLLASSRRIIIQDNLPREEAWNYGAGITLSPTVASRKCSFSAEYFYTDFCHQLCVNFDRDPHAVYLYGLKGNSYSHTLQLELSAELIPDLTFGAAYRLTDVKADYGFGMQQKPLVSRSKGLFTIGYAPFMGLWQFDASLSINGGGRMPTPYALANGTLSWPEKFGAYCLLNAQATRNFRHWSVYIGGENLTGFKQKNPIIDAANPWSNNFDATMIYGPLHGAIIYIGFRYNITKYI